MLSQRLWIYTHVCMHACTHTHTYDVKEEKGRQWWGKKRSEGKTKASDEWGKTNTKCLLSHRIWTNK